MSAYCQMYTFACIFIDIDMLRIYICNVDTCLNITSICNSLEFPWVSCIYSHFCSNKKNLIGFRIPPHNVGIQPSAKIPVISGILHVVSEASTVSYVLLLGLFPHWLFSD